MLKKNLNYRVRIIGGEAYVLGLNSCYILNELAYEIYKRINGNNSLDMIYEDLMSIYEVDKQVLLSDLNFFINDLKIKKIIKEI